MLNALFEQYKYFFPKQIVRGSLINFLQYLPLNSLTSKPEASSLYSRVARGW